MGKITFYFFRHGQSCFNSYSNKTKTGKIIKYWHKINKDPHLTNWGILGSMLSGKYVIDNILIESKPESELESEPELESELESEEVEVEEAEESIIFDNYYVSPLIRTWETAACMFAGTYNEFEVGPYLREGRSSTGLYPLREGREGKPKAQTIPTGSSNMPYPFDDNINRFNNEFKKFINDDNKFGYITDAIKNNNKINGNGIIKKQIININNGFKITEPDNYINTDNKYKLKGSLDKFMLWYANKYPDKDNVNVLVICHGSIILKDFVKTYSELQYSKIKNTSHENNVCFKVTVDFTGTIKNGDIISGNKRVDLFKGENIKLIFRGVHKPKGKNKIYKNNTRLGCSLCNIGKDKCPDNLRSANLNTQLKIFTNPSNFFDDLSEKHNK